MPRRQKKTAYSKATYFDGSSVYPKQIFRLSRVLYGILRQSRVCVGILRQSHVLRRKQNLYYYVFAV